MCDLYTFVKPNATSLETTLALQEKFHRCNQIINDQKVCYKAANYTWKLQLFRPHDSRQKNRKKSDHPQTCQKKTCRSSIKQGFRQLGLGNRGIFTGLIHRRDFRKSGEIGILWEMVCSLSHLHNIWTDLRFSLRDSIMVLRPFHWVYTSLQQRFACDGVEPV